MKHPIKAGLLLMVLAHLVVGGAAIHAALAWFHGGGDPGETEAAGHQASEGIRAAVLSGVDAESKPVKKTSASLGN